MNTILLILAVLSLGVVLVAAYVFTVAARNYVSDSTDDDQIPVDNEDSDRGFVERARRDRRKSHNIIQFPITLVTGEQIRRDRRLGERRSAG